MPSRRPNSRELFQFGELIQKAGDALETILRHDEESVHISALSSEDFIIPPEAGLHPKALKYEWIVNPAVVDCIDWLKGRGFRTSCLLLKDVYFLILNRPKIRVRPS